MFGLLPLSMHKTKPIVVKRYPASNNRSLRAWSAADEYLIKALNELQAVPKKSILYNDSFGYLAIHADVETTDIVCETASQKGAIEKNLDSNKRTTTGQTFLSPFDKPRLKPDVGLLKIPKSLDLFEVYLQHFSQHCSVKGELICGFMTRHFSKQLLELASVYFEDVQQSLAWKKSRLLILKKVKKQPEKDLIHSFLYENETITQHFGVFSAKMIDTATQFLAKNMSTPLGEVKVMDLACGNGILGKLMLDANADLEVHLVDDSFLAIESAKMNVKGKKVHFHQQYTLSAFEPNSFDYIACNPPFHVDHEIDISIPIRLFKEAHACLKVDGVMEIVANQHLNYKTHLIKMFSSVDIVKEDDKYVVYRCVK